MRPFLYRECRRSVEENTLQHAEDLKGEDCCRMRGLAKATSLLKNNVSKIVDWLTLSSMTRKKENSAWAVRENPCAPRIFWRMNKAFWAHSNCMHSKAYVPSISANAKRETRSATKCMFMQSVWSPLQRSERHRKMAAKKTSLVTE